MLVLYKMMQSNIILILEAQHNSQALQISPLVHQVELIDALLDERAKQRVLLCIRS